MEGRCASGRMLVVTVIRPAAASGRASVITNTISDLHVGGAAFCHPDDGKILSPGLRLSSTSTVKICRREPNLAEKLPLKVFEH
jgi:hypothetical protein